MENTNKIKRSTRYLIPCTHADQFQKTQKGALLIGLIIVMLIFSILSGAMVYLFSSSTIGAAYANSSQRAYYAAEAGARYMIAKYRHTTPQMTTTEFVKFAALNGTIDLPNDSGKAVVTITDSMSGVAVDPTTTVAELTTLNVGGTLTIVGDDALKFPEKNGFFKIAGRPETFRYKIRDEYQLKVVTGQGLPLTVTAGTTVTAPKGQVSIISKGFYPSDSLTSRTIEYGWLLSGGQQGGKKQDNDPMDNSANWADTSNIGTFSAQTVDDDGSALKVDSIDASTHSASARFTGFSNTNLAQAWLDAGGFLSYDVQVKVRNTEPFYFAGMNFRLVNSSDNEEQYSYGVSFVKPRARGYCSVIFGSCYDWEKSPDQNISLIPGIVDTSSGSGILFPGGWKSIENDIISLILGHSYEYGLPTIVLWKHTSAGYQWIAYKILTVADGIVTYDNSDRAYRLVPWSTLMVRISEGYSLTFTNGNTGTSIKEGDIIAAASGGTAKVVMTPILTTGNWSAGTPAAGTLVLANIGGNSSFTTGGALSVGGTRLATVGTYNDTKRNYIRVYYTRPDLIGFANNIETDNNRLGNARNIINWPPDDLTELTKDNDYFTLVQWTGTQLSLGPELVPSLISGNWTFGTEKTWDFNGGLRKYNNGTDGTAQPSSGLAIVPGQTYEVSFTVSGVQGQGFNFSLGGYTSGQIKSSYTGTITATSSGNLIFTPINPGTTFTISNISVKLQRGGLTVSSTSEPNAIMTDIDLISPIWTTSSTKDNFIGPNGEVGAADGVSLFSSGNSATSTYFDDFAIQMDMSGGGAFISPIQQ